MSLAELRKSSKLPAERVDLLAYLLVITRCVEVQGAESAPLPSGAMWAAAKPSTVSSDAVAADPAPPRTSTEWLAATTHAVAPRGPADVGVAEIRRRVASLATETPFATLGLAEGASAEAARAAFFRLGRLWHPDRLPPALAEVKDDVARIWAQMTQAHRVLTDPSARPAVVTRNGR
jgi:hypothetical protein